VFENRVLRRIFGPKRDKATGEWRKLYNEELNDLYTLTNIVHVITSRMRWGLYSTYGGEEGCIEGLGREGDHLGEPGGDGRMWSFRKWDAVVRIGSSWLSIGTGCENL